jgi:hypothetical protein
MKKSSVFLVCFLLLFSPFVAFSQGYNLLQDIGKWIRTVDNTDGNYGMRTTTMGIGTNPAGRWDAQQIMIVCEPNKLKNVAISLEGGFSGFYLDMFVVGEPKVTLYITDSSGKTYNFNGFEVEVSDMPYGGEHGIVIMFINNSSLVSLLKRNDTYEAVLEGNDRGWSCNFTINGGMPNH